MFATLRGLFAVSLMTLNTLIFCPILYVAALLRLGGGPEHRGRVTRLMNTLAECWIDNNNRLLDLTRRIEIDANITLGLERNKWYLVFCNHQSWTDILILQRVLRGHIPMLKFFIKHQLLYVPVLGFAWWLLDFPVMRRYSKEVLARRPELAGKDLEATARSSQKFAMTPVAVLNFLEGTRFTPAKHTSQASPFTHLLRPKSGGAALVVNTLGERIECVVDVTIRYSGPFGFWDFLCGRTGPIRVTARTRPVPQEFIGRSYEHDPAHKAAFQQWVSRIWEEKDAQLADGG
tara:strand:+ start:118 stop:987 length:870 start_codon:yes stop_codon:yes gene_type:complete